MSVVVALKHNGVVYMGSDSQVSGDMKAIYTKECNHKVKHLSQCKHALVGTVGQALNSNLVYADPSLFDVASLSDGVLTCSDVILSIVPKLVDSHIEHGIVSKDPPVHLESQYLIAHHDKLFLLQSNDGAYAVEVEGYAVIGSGAYEAGGSLLETEGRDPIERITQAILASKTYDRYVDFPILIKRTDTLDVTRIEEQVSILRQPKEWTTWD